MPRLTPENLPELARLARMHNTGDHCSAPPATHATFVQQRRMRTSRLAYLHQFGPATIGGDFHYDYLCLRTLQDFLWGKESAPVKDRPILTIEDQLTRNLSSCPPSEGFEAMVVFHPASGKGQPDTPH